MSKFSNVYYNLNENDSNPTHIYYDINIVNNDPTGTKQPVICKFDESRQNAYLKNPSLYHLSVVRFQLDTQNNIPLFIPHSNIGQDDPNQLVYTLTLSYKYNGATFNSWANVYYIPQNMNEPSPSPPIKSQDTRSRYYWVQTHQQFLNMLNNTLQFCYGALSVLVSDAGGNLPTVIEPFFGIDENYFISLYTDTNYGSANDQINIYCNQPLYNLLGGFDGIYYGVNQPDGKSFLFNVLDNGLNAIQINGNPYLKTTQSYLSTPLWNPVKSISFKSNTLPIESNILSSNPNQFNTATEGQLSGLNNNFSPNLTDFVVGTINGTEYKPIILYSPSSEYRLISMNSNTDLFNMDIAVYWVDAFGIEYPLNLYNGSCQIKIMFRLKKFNNV